MHSLKPKEVNEAEFRHGWVQLAGLSASPAKRTREAANMSKRLEQATVDFIVAFAGAQLIRPERANPATDAARTIEAHPGTTSELAAVLDRSCRDCHSNNTVWRWYTQVAPLSWL